MDGGPPPFNDSGAFLHHATADDYDEARLAAALNAFAPLEGEREVAKWEPTADLLPPPQLEHAVQTNGAMYHLRNDSARSNPGCAFTALDGCGEVSHHCTAPAPEPARVLPVHSGLRAAWLLPQMQRSAPRGGSGGGGGVSRGGSRGEERSAQLEEALHVLRTRLLMAQVAITIDEQDATIASLKATVADLAAQLLAARACAGGSAAPPARNAAALVHSTSEQQVPPPAANVAATSNVSDDLRRQRLLQAAQRARAARAPPAV